jgi:excisionase family DNA binding protein
MSGTAPMFYTVSEVAEILRVDPATIYRSIRANAFPAIRIRSRYVIPATAVIEMAEEASRSGVCLDLGRSTREAQLGRAVTHVRHGRGA